ncbi:MAG: helix-turn-helix domain-containing protein [Gammaproteobacteria bacterium]|nr:helix-turn-helix domain-containing protein [Gammaproteobacteria bacterium]
MNEDTTALRSDTIALDALIRKTVSQAETASGQSPVDRMLFLGNRHQSFPTAVIKDPVLEPVDKIIWMVIMLTVRETSGATAFPGYEAIGKMANVSSRSTIARGIAILRATRWLTLCARIRKANGRFRGNVYALHDEPIPLNDALHLDADYMRFLKDSLDHGHARVRQVTQAVLDSINEDIEAGQDVCARVHPLEHRIWSSAATQGDHPRRFFALTQNAIKRLRSDEINSERHAVHHGQNSNPASQPRQILHAQNSNLDGSSNNKKTTTTKNGMPTNFTLTGEDDCPLIYPTRLSDNHRELAAHYLAKLAAEQRQPVLDELEGRIQAEARGMKPVYDEISFLHSLCKLTRQGKFRPNLGLKVRDQRREQERRRERLPDDRSKLLSTESEPQPEQRFELGLKHLAEMRKVLGVKGNDNN